MKKSLLALAVLGAYAGVASAQSSVTLYGTLDMAGTYVKNEGQSRRLSLATNGINSSQLGFRGVEDLGGGLKAGFNLLADLAGIDSGNVGSRFFGRRSTVSLFSNAGELRLGRDYTPTFWNQTIFDAFGTNGLGSTLNVRQAYAGTRQDNTIGYFLPSNIGGVYGQLMVGAAEGGSSGDRAARYLGGRVGFAAGPFDVAFAYSQERFAVGANISGTTGVGQVLPIAGGDKQKTWNIGGSWDFGVAKLYGFYNRNTWGVRKQNVYDISVGVPLGQGELRGVYAHADASGGGTDANDANLYSIEYVYNLSKRTAIYCTAAQIKNKGAAAFSVLPGTAVASDLAGGKSTGLNLGIRHSF